MSEDFQRQVKAWGMTPSYAFVAQPETNGVIERLFRTFKEQVVHGRIFQTIDEVRDAVRAFVARYNTEWLVEKNGLVSPKAARERWMAANPKQAASCKPLSREPGWVHSHQNENCWGWSRGLTGDPEIC
ncbi:MAG: hypothetical protein EA406_00190 [Rhodospirillales bacterium]|nr:MAG: hypothetical protein EA406_00190 [Rhodospirillales bacterium]